MRVLIRDAQLIDGTGSPAVSGDLLIEDDHIAEIGATSLPPDETLDARGLVVVPGFIDMHSHGDFTLPNEGEARSKVLQGVTTEVVGNCGLGVFPANDRVESFYAMLSPMLFGQQSSGCSKDMAAYRDRLHASGISVNAAPLVAHGNVRCFAMGLDERASTASELGVMREVLDASMAAGAFGLSTGLVYPPGAFAETEEIVELAKVSAAHHGIYATHMRDEGADLVRSVEETLRIGREAKVSVQISHHKAAGRFNWGKVVTTLGMVDQARADGMDVHSDVYPYTAGSTVLAAMVLPLWVFEGSPERVLERLADPATRAKVIHDSQERIMKYARLPAWATRLLPQKLLRWFVLDMMSRLLVVSSVKKRHEVEGLTLRAIAKARNKPLYEMILDMLIEEELAVVGIAHVIAEDDMQRVMRHPFTMIGTDGFPQRDGKPRPRTYGTYPRVLEHYVRGLHLFGLETAIHKMTGMVSKKLGMKDRGELRVGARADVVILDVANVRDHATYAEPRKHPDGIKHVFVNGAWTVKDGQHTGERRGRVLDRRA